MFRYLKVQMGPGVFRWSGCWTSVRQKTVFGNWVPIFYCIIPLEHVGAFENFPLYMLGFLQPLVVWFVVVSKVAASVVYPLPCDAQS